MATGFNNSTDLYEIYNIVQNTMIRFPKDLIIASLREFFAKDSTYHYVCDEWGFPKTVDHTDLDPNAGLYDDVTTRIYIGEAYRYDGIYYPAVLIRSGAWRYVPISMNRDQHRVDYETVKYVDDDGNELLVQQPYAIVMSGAWEGSLTIDILTRGMRERDDLVELISAFLMSVVWNDAFKSGVSIKPNLNISSPSEGEDRNDKLFKQSITIELRTEWRREIPVENIVDTINFCIDFASDLQEENISPAPNLTINNTVELLDELQALV